ncbi:hypothetical protein JCM16303_005674 [Sporobolomyces ruberrimus]
MGGGAIINQAVSNVKRCFTLDPQQAANVGIVPDTLACIYTRIRRRSVGEVAHSALDWFQSLRKRFAFVWVPCEGLAKVGKETRGTEPEPQVLTPVVPLIGPVTYQGVRAAEQVMVDVYSSETVGKQGIRRFDTFKGIGDADGNQAYVAAVLNESGIPCYDPADLPDESTSPENSFRLLYDPNETARIDFPQWRSLLMLVSDPNFDLTNLAPEQPFFQPPLSSPSTSNPPRLSMLQLSRDRDGVWTDADLHALSIRLFPNHVLVEYVKPEEVWDEASRIALEKYANYRAARLKSIRQDRGRLDEARTTEISFDGRILSSASYKPTLDDAKMATAFATAQTSDFSGLRAGASIGVLRFLYLCLDCQGDLDKIWETLRFHDIDSYFVRGRKSFLFPLVRQSIVIGVPSNPAELAKEKRQEDGSSNLKSGIYMYNNEIASRTRRRAVRALYSHLLASRPDLPSPATEDNLDSQVVLFEVLHYLGIVPRAGLSRTAPSTAVPSASSIRSDRSSSACSAASPSTASSSTGHPLSLPDLSHYTTALQDSLIKPPLQGHLWDDDDYGAEGTGGLYHELLSEVSSPTRNKGAGEIMEATRETDEHDIEDAAEEEALDSEEEALAAEDEENTRSRSWGEVTAEANRARHLRLRQTRVAQLKKLIKQKLPKSGAKIDHLDELSSGALRAGVGFLEDESLGQSFEWKNNRYLLPYSSYLEIPRLHARADLRSFFSALDIGISTPLHERIEQLIDHGAMESPVVHCDSILPILFLHRNVSQVSTLAVLQFVYLTSLPDIEWTALVPPRLDFLESQLCQKPPFDSLIRCPDHSSFRTALKKIRKIAMVFGLAPPASLSTLNPHRSTFPSLSEPELLEHFGTLFARDSCQRYLVSLTELRRYIFKCGGPYQYGSEIGELGKGRISSPTQEDLNYRLIRHCWVWIEDLVETVVEQARFGEVFGGGIDWVKSDAARYIISEEME